MGTELTPTQKAEIRDLAWRGYSTRQIAPMVGVSASTAGKYAKGYLRPHSGLTRAQVGHMRELRKLGRTIDYIAARIGCHPSTVFRHCRDIPTHRRKGGVRISVLISTEMHTRLCEHATYTDVTLSEAIRNWLEIAAESSGPNPWAIIDEANMNKSESYLGLGPTWRAPAMPEPKGSLS